MNDSIGLDGKSKGNDTRGCGFSGTGEQVVSKRRQNDVESTQHIWKCRRISIPRNEAIGLLGCSVDASFAREVSAVTASS